MAQNAEANILITIKEKGSEALDGIKEGLSSIIKVGTAMVATLVAVGAAIGKLAKDASQFEDIRAGFERLAEAQGASGDLILENMKKASQGIISQVNLLKFANDALLEGIPIDKLSKIVELARVAASSTGESVEQMMYMIANGISRGSQMMLRHAGIVFDADEAYKKFAKSLHINTDELTEAQKKQVFLTEALKAGQATLNKFGEAQVSVNDQWARIKATQEENAIVLGQKLIPAVRVLLNLFEDLDLGFKKSTDSSSGIFESMTYAASQTLYAFQIVGNSIQNIITNLYATSSIMVAFFKGNYAQIKQISEDADKEIAERRLSIETSAQERITTIYKEENDRREKTQAQKDKDKAAKDIELAKTREANKEKEIINIRKQWEDKYVQSDFDTFSEQLDIKKKMEADALEERIKKREEAEQLEKQYMENFVSGVQTATSQGLEGLTSKTLGYITDSFIPGAGAAVSSIFDLLSQSTDEFNQKLSTLFGPEFIDNVMKNLISLVQAIPGILDKIINYLSENMPAITEQLISSIIANLPKITSALLKAFVEMAEDPRFYGAMASAIAKGFIEGIHQAATEISDTIKKAFNDAINALNPVSKVGGGGGADTLRRVATDWATGGASELKNLNPFAHGGLIKGYAGGGLIDNQLIRAHAGEYVVNKDSSQANLDLLNRVNNSNGREVSTGNPITIIVNGGMLGDRQSAQEFARAVDEELYRLRQGNASRAFDRSLA